MESLFNFAAKLLRRFSGHNNQQLDPGEGSASEGLRGSARSTAGANRPE